MFIIIIFNSLSPNALQDIQDSAVSTDSSIYILLPYLIQIPVLTCFCFARINSKLIIVTSSLMLFFGLSDLKVVTIMVK